MGERYRLFMKMVEYYDHLHLVPAIQIETYSGEFCIRLTRKCENSQMTSKCFICGYVTHSVRFSFILCPVYAIPILCSEYRDTHTNLCFITYSWNALSLNTLECVCVSYGQKEIEFGTQLTCASQWVSIALLVTLQATNVFCIFFPLQNNSMIHRQNWQTIYVFFVSSASICIYVKHRRLHLLTPSPSSLFSSLHNISIFINTLTSNYFGWCIHWNC